MAMTDAGCMINIEQNRKVFAVQFFRELKAKTTAVDGPPPIGLHLLMGESAPLKIDNVLQNILDGRIAPVDIIASTRR